MEKRLNKNVGGMGFRIEKTLILAPSNNKVSGSRARFKAGIFYFCFISATLLCSFCNGSYNTAYALFDNRSVSLSFSDATKAEIQMDYKHVYSKFESTIEAKFFEAVEKFLHPTVLADAQVEFRVTEKITFRPDFLFISKATEKAIIVECDGKDFHSSFEQEQSDNLRDAAILIRDTEIPVVAIYRFGGSAIHNIPMLCVEKIREATPDFLISYFPKMENVSLMEGYSAERAKLIEIYGDAKMLAYERANDLITVHNRKWLADSGIVAKARFVVKESAGYFNSIELEYAKHIINKYNG